MEHLAATDTSAGTWWKPKERSKLFDGVFIKLLLTTQGKWSDKRKKRNLISALSRRRPTSWSNVSFFYVLEAVLCSVEPHHLTERSFSTRKLYHSNRIWMRSSVKIPLKILSLLFYLDKLILSLSHVCCFPAATALRPFFVKHTIKACFEGKSIKAKSQH